MKVFGNGSIVKSVERRMGMEREAVNECIQYTVDLPKMFLIIISKREREREREILRDKERLSLRGKERERKRKKKGK